MTDETNPKPRGGRPKRDRSKPAAEYNHDRSLWTTRPIEPQEILSKAGIVIAEKGERLTPQEKGQRLLEALVPDAVMRIAKLAKSKHEPTRLAANKYIINRGLPRAPSVAVQVVSHTTTLSELAERARQYLKVEDAAFTAVDDGDEPEPDEAENNA